MLFAAAGFASQARADGDPASDFLVAQTVFAPLDAKIPAANVNQLAKLVADANARGYKIKVALIEAPSDLGSVTSLWRQPQRYAQFLGLELYYVHTGSLLVVMPNGYGIYNHGKPVRAERALLNRLPLPGPTFAPRAALAVQRLAQAQGLQLALPKLALRKSHGARDRIEILAIAIAVVLIGAIAFMRLSGFS